MEVQRKLLLRAIELVLPAVAKKELFEQANKIAFVGGRLAAFNDSVLITHPLPGDLDVEGTVDGRRLHALLGKHSAEVVDISVDNDKMLLRAGRSKVIFDVLPVTLPIDSVDLSGEMVDLPATFVDQLKWVSSSCAKDMSRPALTCVLVADGCMQASDSYRASRVEHGGGDLPQLMIELPQINVLVDYQVRRVALSDGGEWARFETEDGTMLCTRSMSYVFPDISADFEVEGQEVELTAALAPVLERAGIFARREHQVDEEVGISMRPNQVTVSASCEGGRFSEVARCEGAVDGVAFSIPPKFLAAALGSGTRCVVGDNRVLFRGKDWQHIVALKVG